MTFERSDSLFQCVEWSSAARNKKVICDVSALAWKRAGVLTSLMIPTDSLVHFQESLMMLSTCAAPFGGANVAGSLTKSEAKHCPSTVENNETVLRRVSREEGVCSGLRTRILEEKRLMIHVLGPPVL